MSEKKYIISASLVLYNTKQDDLCGIIESVLNSQIDKLYIIDNSPCNEAIAIISAYNIDRFEYFFGHGNIGFGRAHNIAIQKAIALGARYHIVLNPDVQFSDEAIQKLSTYMDKHPDIGQLLPKVIYPNGNLQYLCKLLPTPLDIFGRRLLPKWFIRRRNARYEMHWTGYNNIRNCPILSGCFMFLNVSILKQVGLFDDRFFMYFEDFDLTRRIHSISKTIYYPRVTIIHNHAAEHRHNKKLLKISIISAIRYFNKWGWLIDKERRRVNNEALKQ